jgi:hypothetical protein
MAIRATTDNSEATGRDGAIDHVVKSDLKASRPIGRLFYASSNGDLWYLVRDFEGVAVVHVPNAPSGGRVDRVGIAEFLISGDGPEHQELLRLIGALVES